MKVFGFDGKEVEIRTLDVVPEKDKAEGFVRVRTENDLIRLVVSVMGWDNLAQFTQETGWGHELVGAWFQVVANNVVLRGEI